MAQPKRPLGLMLFSAVLLILALRAIGLGIISGLLWRRLPAPAVQLLSLLVTAIFLISAVGLLQLREWARWLTLAVCSIYCGWMLVNVIALWPRMTVLNGVEGTEAVITLALTWWYLNRKDVRRLFRKPGKSR